MSRPPQTVEARVEARAKSLWRLYGLTVEQYDKQYAEQGGLCMYCHKPGQDLTATGNRTAMVPDEEHDAPFRFRGLAHGKCNQLAGIYEAALKDPPAYGVVDHVISPDRVAARVQREDMNRTRKARNAGKQPREQGERTTYEAADFRGRGRVAVEDEAEDDQGPTTPAPSGLDKLRGMTQPEQAGPTFAEKMAAARREHTGEEPTYQDKIKETLAAMKRREEAGPPPKPTVYATEAQLSYLRHLAEVLGEPHPSDWLTMAAASKRINEWKPLADAKKLRDHPVKEGRKRLVKRFRKDGQKAMRGKSQGGSR